RRRVESGGSAERKRGPRAARRPVGVAACGCYFGEAPHRIGAEPPRPEPSCDRLGLFEAGERAVEIALEPLEPAENSRERLAPFSAVWGRPGESRAGWQPRVPAAGG